ncbi:MAG: low molecular weight phosphotyrosine protein phosphatase [Actinomycetaceae bacterium]|nr:low molecular weight phosphotyrosine protein phosphatase [Actinomycetaceae bacterium]
MTDPNTCAGRDLRTRLDAAPQILVVCTGNICRSPMGEVVLGERLSEAGLDYTVASSGVSDEEHGNPIYPPAAQVLRASGYSVPHRSAHRATTAELRGSGLILAMTVGHARSLRRMCKSVGVPLERLHLWREFDGSGLEIAPHGCFGPGGALDDGGTATTATGARRGGGFRRSSSRDYSDFYSSNGRWDVPDPWFSGDFDATLAVVEKGADGIIAALLAT